MTLYELIRKVGDGNAPNKIKLFDEDFTYDETSRDYEDSEGNKLFEDYYWQEDLDTLVENVCYTIKIDPNNYSFTKPATHKIEKIKVENDRIQAETTGNYCYTLRQIDKILIKKINELTDEVNGINERI